MDTQVPGELGSVELALRSPFCDDVDPNQTLQFLQDPAGTQCIAYRARIFFLKEMEIDYFIDIL